MPATKTFRYGLGQQINVPVGDAFKGTVVARTDFADGREDTYALAGLTSAGRFWNCNYTQSELDKVNPDV
jgi:hypothetical protein